jgi:hypothetical protein
VQIVSQRRYSAMLYVASSLVSVFNSSDKNFRGTTQGAGWSQRVVDVFIFSVAKPHQHRRHRHEQGFALSRVSLHISMVTRDRWVATAATLCWFADSQLPKQEGLGSL